MPLRIALMREKSLASTEPFIKLDSLGKTFVSLEFGLKAALEFEQYVINWHELQSDEVDLIPATYGITVWDGEYLLPVEVNLCLLSEEDYYLLMADLLQEQFEGGDLISCRDGLLFVSSILEDALEGNRYDVDGVRRSFFLPRDFYLYGKCYSRTALRWAAEFLGSQINYFATIAPEQIYVNVDRLGDALVLEADVQLAYDFVAGDNMLNSVIDVIQKDMSIVGRLLQKEGIFTDTTMHKSGARFSVGLR